MKYLRNFPDAETRDEVLSNITYNVLSYTHGEGVSITDNSITLNLYPGDGNITVEYFENPDQQYKIAYDAETPFSNILEGLGITPRHWCICTDYEIDDDRVYFIDAVDPSESLSSLGVLPGSTLYFAPNLV